MSVIIGWDIGGAHLKCARVEDGVVREARQTPCTLWLGTEHLDSAFATLKPMTEGASLHAVTMTGELAEIFPSRAEGVAAIIAQFQKLCEAAPLYIYAGRAGFLQPRAAAARPEDVASANWHASAALAAQKHREALFIDIGSTTSDIIPLHGGVAARGYTDAERLVTGELVYTGVMRTSIMALARFAPFAGELQRVMAENFSTAADIYRLSGELRAEDDQYPASDGRGKSAPECRARLARMLGRDRATASDAAWDALARYFRERQIGLLYDAAAQVLSGIALAEDAPVIGAGAGNFLAREIAGRLHRPYLEFGALFGAQSAAQRAASLCAPAAAVALLAQHLDLSR